MRQEGKQKKTIKYIFKIHLKVFKPVCGVNSKTYFNDCTRKCKKVKLNHTGKCIDTRMWLTELIV